MSELREKYRPDIDGLRALAIVGVLLYHAFPALLPGGYLGVDVFFVISGFLITRLIRAETSKGIFRFGHFYFRRARRLLPPLLVVLLCTLALGWRVFLPDELPSLAKNLLAGALFVSNLFLRGGIGYFDPSVESNPLQHLWSLGVEEQFYLFWPLILVLVFRHSPKKVLEISALLFAASFALDLKVAAASPNDAFYLLPTRLWELLAGGLLALHEGKAKGHGALGWVGLALIGGAFIFPGEARHSPLLGLVSVLGTASVVFAGPFSSAGRALSLAPLVELGKISYPLYLWHWPLLVFGTALGFRAFAIPLALLFAWATSRGLENPLRRVAPSFSLFSRRRLPVAALVTLFSSILAFSAVILLRAETLWQDAQLSAIEPTFRHPGTGDEECRNLPGSPRSVAYCRLGPGQGEPTVALIGDSHANHLFPGLAEEYAKKGQRLILLGNTSCPPFADPDYHPPAHWISQDACLSGLDDIHRFLVANHSIRKVVLTFFYQKRRYWKSAGRELASAGKIWIPFLTAKLNQRILKLSNAGKEVVVFADAPNMGVDAHDCFRRWRLGLEAGPRCEIDQAAVEERLTGYDPFFDRVSPRACVFKARDAFKGEQGYFMISDGHVLYRDSRHLNLYGSRFIASRFQRSACF